MGDTNDIRHRAVDQKRLANYSFGTVPYDVIRCVVMDAMFDGRQFVELCNGIAIRHVWRHVCANLSQLSVPSKITERNRASKLNLFWIDHASGLNGQTLLINGTDPAYKVVCHFHNFFLFQSKSTIQLNESKGTS